MNKFSRIIAMKTMNKKDLISEIHNHHSASNNKFHRLSPFGGHHSLLFNQGFLNIMQLQCHLVRPTSSQSEGHLTVFCIDEIVPDYLQLIEILQNRVKIMDFDFEMIFDKVAHGVLNARAQAI